MLSSDAYAQAAGSVSGGMSFVTFIPFILIFAIMYFLIIRPQRIQMKKRQEMLNAVRRGDVVVTGGGIVGKVVKVFSDSGELDVEIAEGMSVRVVRSTLADVRVKGEPLSEKELEARSQLKVSKNSASKATVKTNAVAAKKQKGKSGGEKAKV
ncbi:preprotein translocase subunit YajC [Bartonella ancashensis]|uniref:Sec translocon accessory complex subunit YajC n=1 Tax=Bartonella ancashensis TaxID=1318743 RepID=A0A0M4M495_9HYPH|nr:preprotein translocase subunit YajC [Bartonella ancashensis]ALE03949.1 Preprotein translocase subunit YajC [Bartonella ancashensis]